MFAMISGNALAVVLVGIYFAAVAAVVALVLCRQRNDANDQQ